MSGETGNLNSSEQDICYSPLQAGELLNGQIQTFLDSPAQTEANPKLAELVSTLVPSAIIHSLHDNGVEELSLDPSALNDPAESIREIIGKGADALQSNDIPAPNLDTYSGAQSLMQQTDMNFDDAFMQSAFNTDLQEMIEAKPPELRLPDSSKPCEMGHDPRYAQPEQIPEASAIRPDLPHIRTDLELQNTVGVAFETKLAWGQGMSLDGEISYDREHHQLKANVSVGQHAGGSAKASVKVYDETSIEEKSSLMTKSVLEADVGGSLNAGTIGAKAGINPQIGIESTNLVANPVNDMNPVLEAHAGNQRYAVDFGQDSTTRRDWELAGEVGATVGHRHTLGVNLNFPEIQENLEEVGRAVHDVHTDVANYVTGRDDVGEEESLGYD